MRGYLLNASMQSCFVVLRTKKQFIAKQHLFIATSGANLLCYKQRNPRGCCFILPLRFFLFGLRLPLLALQDEGGGEGRHRQGNDPNQHAGIAGGGGACAVIIGQEALVGAAAELPQRVLRRSRLLRPTILEILPRQKPVTAAISFYGPHFCSSAAALLSAQRL